MSDRELNLSIKFDAVDKASGKLKALTAEGKAMAKSLTDSRAAMKKLGEAQSSLDRFVAGKKKVADLRKEFEGATAKVKSLSKEMKATEAPSKSMQRSFNAAVREAGKAKQAWSSQNTALEQQRRQLSQAGYHTNQLAMYQRSLKGRTEEATKAIERQTKAMRDGFKTGSILEPKGGKGGGGISGSITGGGGPGSTTDKAVKAGLIVGTINEVKNIVGAPIIKYATAEKQLADIRIKGSLTAAETEKLGESLDALSPHVRKTAAELRDATDFLASIGSSPRDALKMLPSMGRTSHAFGADIRDVAKGSFMSMKNMGFPVGSNNQNLERETAIVTDMIANAANVGAIEVNDWAGALGELTTTMKTLGLTGRQNYASLLAAGEVTYNGDAAKTLNNLQNLIDKIASPDVKKNFSERGVDIMGEIRKAVAAGGDPFIAIAEQTRIATKGNLDSISSIFGDVQARQAIAAILNNQPIQKDMTGKIMNNSAGSVDAAFAITMETTASKWDLLGAKWGSIGEKFGGAVDGLTKWVLDTAANDPKPSAMSAALPLGLGALWDLIANRTGSKTSPAKPAGAKGSAAEASSQKQTNAIWGDRLKKIESVDKKVSALQPAVRSKSMAIGYALPTGIAAGMDAGMPVLDAKLAAMASRMQSQPKSMLEIRSPSRVFARMGRDVVAGLTQGIDRSAADPAAAMMRVTSGMTPAFPGPSSHGGAPGGAFGAAGGASGAPITINVYGAQGQDVQTLADIVARKIGDARGIAERSTYDDGN